MLGFKQLIGKKTTSTAAWDVEMGKRPETEDQSAPPSGICSEILGTGIWRLWLVLAVFYTCKLSTSQKLSQCLKSLLRK